MTTHDPIPARLAALKTTPTPDLKAQWRELFDSEPPPFNRRYLESRLAYLNETVQRWKRIVGAEPGRFVQVMDLGYRWGSCSADGTLNFHWRVMQLPPRIIEYVVVHELVHIKVPDHSEKFWKTLGSVMPDYERRKAWLKQNGGDY